MLALIVARSKNNVIGKGGRTPWSIEGEQKQFKELTTGNIVIMGRRTYEEIGHPLPGRQTIVVSRSKDFDGENLRSAGSLKEALEKASEMGGRAWDGEKHSTPHIFIAGGYRLYKAALPLVDTMYITEVDLTVEDGDTFFPTFNIEDFDLEIGESGGREIKYTRMIYRRKKHD